MRARGLIITGVVLVAALLVAMWIIDNTYWEEISIPTALRGEAATDPYYAAKALVRELGGTASESTLFADPATDSVIYLSGWNWNLGDARRRQLERWVEAGGRLVLDESVFFLGEEFTRWSGLQQTGLDASDAGVAAQLKEIEEDECRQLHRQGLPVLADEGPQHSYLVCGLYAPFLVTSQRAPEWSLRDEFGVHGARVRVGRGSVTLLRADPFTWRQLLREDHPELFVGITQLRRGDHVQFITERRYPSLLALTWQFGWPAIGLGAVALALLLWRWGTRFGPLAAPAAHARRSLAEQIRGTGRFVMQRGSGVALVAASGRALHAAARRALPGYDALDSAQRIAAIAAATGANETALAQALGTRADAGMRTFTAAIVHLETIRHRILSNKPGRTHGS